MPQYNTGDLVQGEYPPKLGWNRGGVTQEHKTCNICETVQDRTNVTMTDYVCDFLLVPD